MTRSRRRRKRDTPRQKPIDNFSNIIAVHDEELVVSCYESGHYAIPGMGKDGKDLSIKRARLFHVKGKKCVSCGREGTEWVTAVAPDGQYHFQLQGEDENGRFYMSVDHIIPRSKGGRNHMDNYQPMCCDCNCAKGNKSPFPFKYTYKVVDDVKLEYHYYQAWLQKRDIFNYLEKTKLPYRVDVTRCQNEKYQKWLFRRNVFNAQAA